MIVLFFLLCCGRVETGGRTDREDLLSAARTDSRTLTVLRETERLATHEDWARAATRLREAAIP